MLRAFYLLRRSALSFLYKSQTFSLDFFFASSVYRVFYPCRNVYFLVKWIQLSCVLLLDLELTVAAFTSGSYFLFFFPLIRAYLRVWKNLSPFWDWMSFVITVIRSSEDHRHNTSEIKVIILVRFRLRYAWFRIVQCITWESHSVSAVKSVALPANPSDNSQLS